MLLEERRVCVEGTTKLVAIFVCLFPLLKLDWRGPMKKKYFIIFSLLLFTNGALFDSTAPALG